MNKLVVVESPTKAKTISKFLGKDYEVKSSKGHIRDLPKKELGVDVEHEFKPHYVIMPGKKKIVSDLKKAAKDASEVYLATDLDREGEAIAAHVYDVLRSSSKFKVQSSKFHRVVFHEITESAIKNAFARSRELDLNLFDAYQARRVLDRLVGYKLSPLLWKKIRYGLSAGRVQSVAVRLIVEREREREDFNIENYYRIFAVVGEKNPFETELVKIEEKQVEQKTKLNLFAGSYTYTSTIFDSEQKLQKTLGVLSLVKSLIVSFIERKETTLRPYPPFTTASLQRSASTFLGFSAKQTMVLAQNLYENGYITYHRTDSTNLAKQFLEKARQYIKKEYGERYIPKSARHYQTKAKSAQEAHEAVRITEIANCKLQIANVKGKLGKNEAHLYELIWRRTLASQMSDAVYDNTTIQLTPVDEHLAKDYLFEAKGSIVKFDGFLRVLEAGTKDKILPAVKEGEKLELLELKFTKHETQPPPRYNEASLVKDLEKHEIGRPSTYAPIISTIQERHYVVKEDKYFRPEDIGIVVNDLLVAHFPKIVDLKFTARMEDDLDKIAGGEKAWVPVVREFYEPFEKELRIKNEELRKGDITTLEKTNEKCPECGRFLVIKLGKYGKFLSCSGFPECKYGRPFEDKNKDGKPDDVDKSQLERKCPECGGGLILKEGRFGKFIACSNYPKCKFTRQYLDKIGMKCPECSEGEVIVKRSRRGKIFFGCSRYPDCKWASWEKPQQK